jgi:hypothetical protein
MPLLPLGLGKNLLERVKTRIDQFLRPKDPPPSSPTEQPTELLEEEHVEEEVPDAHPGGDHDERPPANTPEEVLLRIREAVMHDPPVLLHALYEAKDAPGEPTWRYLEPYELADIGTGTMLYAWCSKDPVIKSGPKRGKPKVELFNLGRFHDCEVTDIPFRPRWDLAIRKDLSVRPDELIIPELGRPGSGTGPDPGAGASGRGGRGGGGGR